MFDLSASVVRHAPRFMKALEEDSTDGDVMDSAPLGATPSPSAGAREAAKSVDGTEVTAVGTREQQAMSDSPSVQSECTDDDA